MNKKLNDAEKAKKDEADAKQAAIDAKEKAEDDRRMKIINDFYSKQSPSEPVTETQPPAKKTTPHKTEQTLSQQNQKILFKKTQEQEKQEEEPEEYPTPAQIFAPIA